MTDDEKIHFNSIFTKVCPHSHAHTLEQIGVSEVTLQEIYKLLKKEIKKKLQERRDAIVEELKKYA